MLEVSKIAEFVGKKPLPFQEKLLDLLSKGRSQLLMPRRRPPVDAFPNVVCCTSCQRIFWADYIATHWETSETLESWFEGLMERFRTSTIT